jgi:hypothetical protein
MAVSKADIWASAYIWRKLLYVSEYWEGSMLALEQLQVPASAVGQYAVESLVS